jgi:hypothetical protein
MMRSMIIIPAGSKSRKEKPLMIKKEMVKSTCATRKNQSPAMKVLLLLKRSAMSPPQERMRAVRIRVLYNRPVAGTKKKENTQSPIMTIVVDTFALLKRHFALQASAAIVTEAPAAINGIKTSRIICYDVFHPAIWIWLSPKLCLYRTAMTACLILSYCILSSSCH